MKLEQTILKNLIYNDEYLRKVLPFIKSEYFTNRTQAYFANAGSLDANFWQGYTDYIA